MLNQFRWLGSLLGVVVTCNLVMPAAWALKPVEVSAIAKQVTF
ncbi:MAG: hypothetical protein ACFCU8_16765 [Thermosynechococcaceae cyanobacterium]